MDDEPVARRVLRKELGLCPDVRVIGEAADGKEALQKIEQLKPDVVFLDLQMPVMSGFEVVQNLSGPALPVVVMVSAFDQQAIEAFETGTIHYLVKPVSDARLQRSVDWARKLLGRPGRIAAEVEKIAAFQLPAASRTRKVVGRSGEEYFQVDLDHVLAFQAERELVWIVMSNTRLLATQSLRKLEQRLSDDQFLRVNRNAIVNVNHVRKLTAISSQRWLITLSNALQVTVSKRQAYTVRKLLNW